MWCRNKDHVITCYENDSNELVLASLQGLQGKKKKEKKKTF